MRNPIDFVALRAVSWQADRLYRRFLAAADDAVAVQDRVLAAKVGLHADSDFGRAHHFGRIRTYREFAANVPVGDYERFRPYIERVKRGEFGALLGGGRRPLMFALTSGTTSEPKYIPVTREFLDDYRRGWLVFGIKLFGDHPEAILRPILQVTSPMDEFRTPGGTPCGAITGMMAATQKRLVRRHYIAPLCVADIKDSLAKYYTLMRLAVPRDVAVMFTANPSTHLRLAEVADAHREELIRDIHDGTLSDAMAVDGAVRAKLRRSLRAEPAVARRLAGLVSEHGALRPKDYWRLAFQGNWTGGTMGLYLQHLPKWFGDVPVRDIGLMASEGRMSIPLVDGSPAGVLDVERSFFEFVPADQIEWDRPDVLRCHELEVGQCYFVLLTTSSGLYRYDIRDMVRVVGYQGLAPVIEFLHKGAHVSSMAGEKLTERQVVDAVAAVGSRLGMGLDAVVLAPRWAELPYYALYVEAGAVAGQRGKSVGQVCPTYKTGSDVAVRLAEGMDAALAGENMEYASKRQTRRLGPVAVCVVPAGCLVERDREASRGGRAEQFKHQFLLTQPGADGDLAARVDSVGMS